MCEKEDGERKAATFMRFPGGKAKALTLSYDDGVEQDGRLIAIMKARGLKGTFNLNSGLYAPEGTVYEAGTIHRRMTRKQADALYGDSGMEVAVHGLTHPFLEQLSQNRCTREVLCDRENLEKQFGCIVRGMAYPYGTFDDEVVECLKACGIVYARTTVSTGTFDLPRDWLRLAATCHHNDPRLMELARKFVEKKTSRAPWLFYLWGHSYEFEQNDNWNVIEEFAAYTGGREDVWYATNLEIYEYVHDYEQLIFSTDGSMVCNPTARTLYFATAYENREVKAGETKALFG